MNGTSILSKIHLLRDPSKPSHARRATWTNRFDTPDGQKLNLTLFCAFEGVRSFPFKAMIFQFWRPLTDRGRLVLESFRNAYSLPPFIRHLEDKYKAYSNRYHYIIDDGDVEEGDNQPEPAWIIRGGPVPTAFLNRFPEVVMDLRAHQGSPLVDLALECGLTCCVMLPVFYGSSSKCVGVLECSLKHPSLLLPIFIEMKQQLEGIGMTIYPAQGSWSHKTISPDLEPVKAEIEKGLKMACESHRLTIGQVWTPYESESESKNDQMLLVKLGRYFGDSTSSSSVKDFYDKLDVIPLKRGEGLAGKTLETHQPHVCRNIYKLSDNGGLLALLSNAKCASFVICLRSAHTGELDYLFEFFWPCSRNHLILSETILLTLKKYLPSFKFVSGEQLDDEIFVVEAETNINNNNLEVEDDDDDDVAILATYRNESLLFDLPRSFTFENVMEKLNKEFELDRASTYKVEYEVLPYQWSSFVSLLESCKRKEDTCGLIKLRLRAEGEVSWQWITN